MLRERVLVALVLIPIGGGIIYLGGWIFGFAFTLVLVLAVAEYGSMYKHATLRPATPMMIAAVATIGVLRYAIGFRYGSFMIVFICLLAVAWHVVDYERGSSTSGTDFAITLTGVMYVGWVGAYMISLRNLDGGLWWFLIVFPSLWVADSAAYFIGKAIGRHRMAPRVSPKKTWEGYSAGIIMGGITGLGVSALALYFAGPAFNGSLLAGLIIGLVISTLAPMGDLGISMMKRELGIKDSGKLLPGHGGVLDRIDSWIWAGALGFYLIPWITALAR